MSSKSKVYFFFHGINVSLKKRNRLKKQIERIFKDERKRLGSLNYVFCSDSEILRINREFLRHDYFTDIITFDLSETNNSTVGEIYISAERVRDNAKQIGERVGIELHRVIFHGALHLCGYNDKIPADKREMRKKEQYYLDRFLGNG